MMQFALSVEQLLRYPSRPSPIVLFTATLALPARDNQANDNGNALIAFPFFYAPKRKEISQEKTRINDKKSTQGFDCVL
jgi:hypothetical protein